MQQSAAKWWLESHACIGDVTLHYTRQLKKAQEEEKKPRILYSVIFLLYSSTVLEESDWCYYFISVTAVSVSVSLTPLAPALSVVLRH